MFKYQYCILNNSKQNFFKYMKNNKKLSNKVKKNSKKKKKFKKKSRIRTIKKKSKKPLKRIRLKQEEQRLKEQKETTNGQYQLDNHFINPFTKFSSQSMTRKAGHEKLNP